jgi:hypothetical protein
MDKEHFEQRILPLIELAPRTTTNSRAQTHYESCCVPKIKPQTQTCDDCGRKVKGRVVSIKRVEDEGDPHWRKRCNICKFVSISKLEIK